MTWKNWMAALAIVGSAVFSVFAATRAGSVVDQAKEVEFLSPWEGSHLPGGNVVIIGRLSRGKGNIGLFLNGREVRGLKRDKSAFTAVVTPVVGKNVVEVREQAVIGRLTFNSGPKSDGRPVFSFHAPLAKGECQKCHLAGGNNKIGEARACYGCHPRWDKNPFLHGPVGAGECVFCHDPHGSSYPGLSRYEEKKQCSVCHDQPSSQDHMSRRQNQNCRRCHDPHGGKDRYFLKSV